MLGDVERAESIDESGGKEVGDVNGTAVRLCAHVCMQQQLLHVICYSLNCIVGLALRRLKEVDV